MNNEGKPLPNELLQYERERRNWSREYVAQQVGAPEERMIGRWEREGVLPAPRYRQQLCELYSKSAKELGFVKQGEVPFWNIPYRRNPFFTGREEMLAQAQAMSGLGGIGKTQVALEYAYRYKHEYQAVLWVRAESRDALTSDFAALATLLNLLEKEAQDQSKIIDAVKGWLVTLSRWLLILDNVEDLQLLSEFLPQVVKGHALLTTRLQAGGAMAHLIEVMEPEEGALFLLRHAKILAQDAPLDTASYTDWTQARGITEVMGGLPLALDQAGTYIEETKCGQAEYHARYQTHGSALLSERGSLAPDHPEAVVSTFLLSFEKVDQANPAAADLLRLCAFLATDAISEEIITEGASGFGPLLQPIAADPLQLERVIKQLLKYSLLGRNRYTKTLTIHRLVQAVLRNEMNEDLQRLWAERTVRTVNLAFPEVEFVNWQCCDRCIPHMQECATLTDQWNLAFPEAAQLLDKAGIYSGDRAQYTQSEHFLTKGLALRVRVLGEEHLEVAESLLNLGEIYNLWGKSAGAEPLFIRAIAIWDQKKDLSIIKACNCLAMLYQDQGKYIEAELLYQRAL